MNTFDIWSYEHDERAMPLILLLDGSMRSTGFGLSLISAQAFATGNFSLIRDEDSIMTIRYMP